MNNIVELDTTRGRDLRAEIAALQASNSKLTQAEIARQSGVGSTRINQWLNGRYPGDNAALEQDIARWVDAYRERELQRRALPAAPAWVSTPSAERVLAALAYAQTAGDIAVIYGGAGLGKTTAILQYQRISPNVWHATMSPCMATVVPCYEEVADALGLRELPQGASRIQRALVKRIAGTKGLLVVDEAQHLSVGALDGLRALHDATGVGVALVGNEAVYARMTGGNRAAYLDRLYSRVGKRVRLLRSTQDDVDALLSAWGISDRAIRNRLRQVGGDHGGLRSVTKVLRLASMLAGGGEKSRPGLDEVEAAISDLGGE